MNEEEKLKLENFLHFNLINLLIECVYSFLEAENKNWDLNQYSVESAKVVLKVLKNTAKAIKKDYQNELD